MQTNNLIAAAQPYWQAISTYRQNPHYRRTALLHLERTAMHAPFDCVRQRAAAAMEAIR